MNLIVDVGNTLIKIAVFQDDELVFKKAVSSNDFKKQIEDLLKKYPIEHGIVSSVGKLQQSDLLFLNQNMPIVELHHKLKFPFKNLYATPNTLGVDRIALIAAAVRQYPNKNVLVIDAGSCITYDFLNDATEYLGGAISPGLKMRYNALNYFTERLPLLEIKKPQQIIGNSTNNSMHSGVVNGMILEIDGFVKECLKKHEDLTVILTGGDSDFLSKQLKSSIFANPNFLLQGLNYILHYNIIE